MKLPEAFDNNIRKILGSETDSFFKAVDKQPLVSIRINPDKMIRTFVNNESEEAIDQFEPVCWASNAYYLSSRPSFTLDPLFHAGCYYVQEASSMFLEQVIKSYIKNPVKCLDLCAAPGGKSTHLISVLPEGSLLVSNEIIASRAQVLAENLIKWGNPSIIVTNNDSASFGRLNEYFDLIVADVPCSGEGMFRKDKNAIEEWSSANVKLCSERQRQIITGCWDSLKPGGLLIYSTCTFNMEENEENVNWIKRELGADILPVEINKDWNISNAVKYDDPVYRFFFHKTKGEGFFIAILRKNESLITGKSQFRKNGKNKKRKAKWIPNADCQWLKPEMQFNYEITDNKILAFPLVFDNDYQLLSETLHIIHAGIHYGEIKGKDLIPTHNLAMSTFLKRDVFPEIELDKVTAINYLRKEAIYIPDIHMPKGYAIVKYKNYPLGFVKNIGNRWNNLYPQHWKIRKTI